MSFISLKIILVVILLVLLTLQQRGGGRVGGSRGFSSIRFGRAMRKFRSDSKKKISKKSSTQNYINMAGTSVLIGGLVFVVYKIKNQKKNQRRLRIEEIFNNFQRQCSANLSTQNSQELLKSKDWFMQQKWSMKIMSKNGSLKDNIDVTIKDIKNKSDHIYRFKMSMSDSVGDSQIYGVLIRQINGFSIKFQKTYNNREKAGQTGQFDLLLYQGKQYGQAFSGRWQYKNFQDSLGYSGTWRMTHK